MRSRPETGIALELKLCTGTVPVSEVPWLVGCCTSRRPLSSTSVLPTPSERRLTELTSPRAALLVCGLLDASNSTSPICGMVRISSSPEIAPAASICSAPTTITGSASVVDAPWMCEPTTVTLSSVVGSSVGADCGAGSAGGVASCAAAAWITASKARVRPLRNGAERRLNVCIFQSLL